MANAQNLLDFAQGEVGYSRWDDPQAGTKYGRWYAELTGDSYFGESGVPYCAMFVSYCLANIGATAPGIPGAYCPSIVNEARRQGRFFGAASAQPGDLVLFDWGSDSVSDHIGICKENHSGWMDTTEGNTGNGCVANRARNHSLIMGCIRPDWDGSTADTSGESSGGGIEVDGLWGPATTRALQSALGTPQDGIVSDQYSAYRAANPGLMSASWEWHNHTSDGSLMIRALQGKVGSGVDGFAGPNTFTALQAYLGTCQDGCISNPSDCVKAMQRRLNDGNF